MHQRSPRHGALDSSHSSNLMNFADIVESDSCEGICGRHNPHFRPHYPQNHHPRLSFHQEAPSDIQQRELYWADCLAHSELPLYPFPHTESDRQEGSLPLSSSARVRSSSRGICPASAYLNLPTLRSIAKSQC